MRALKSFEVLITESNILNRKLEDILGVGKEFETISALWGRFHQLVQEQQQDVELLKADGAGMPGTGGHVVAPKSSQVREDFFLQPFGHY